MSNDDNYINCCISSVCSLIFFIICIITIPSFVIPYFDAQSLAEEICYINNIEYPTTNPTFENYDNWGKCDCGKNCISYSPCIKLYTNISSELIIEQFPEYKEVCTFHDSYCRNGEDIRNIENYLQESQEIYDSYINTTQTCYIDKEGYIFLEKNVSFGSMVASLIIIGIYVICFLVFCLYINFQNCSKNKEENTNDTTFYNYAYQV